MLRAASSGQVWRMVSTVGAVGRRGLGIVDRANIAQVAVRFRRYVRPVSPVVRPRRRAYVRYAGAGVLVGRVEDEPRLWRGMKDRHGFVAPERGRWEFLYRGGRYRQAPGTLQLKQPGELYCDVVRDEPATYDVVLFEPATLDAARAASSAAGALVLASPQLAAGDPRARALLRLCRLGEERDGAGSRLPAATSMAPLAIETLVAEAALALVALCGGERAIGRERSAVQRARAYLTERLAEPVRLDDVADHVRLDKYHLIRAFRAEVGAPPYEFLTHARVHRARELLRQGVRAGDAAAAVGFCDQSQLHRHFVRLVGVTPGRYVACAGSSLRVSITQAGERGAARRRAAITRGEPDRT